MCQALFLSNYIEMSGLSIKIFQFHGIFQVWIVCSAQGEVPDCNFVANINWWCVWYGTNAQSKSPDQNIVHIKLVYVKSLPIGSTTI